jgi:N-acetylglucosamine kinase-like BadF-type ATPase
MEGNILGWGLSQAPGIGGRNPRAFRSATQKALGNREFECLCVAGLGAALPLDLFHKHRVVRFEHFSAGEQTSARAQAEVGHGIVLLAGTGAFANARFPDGRERQLDAAGPILGDFGGGYHVGTLALQATLRSEWHPRHATALREAVLNRFNVLRAMELHARNLFCQDRSVVAALSRLVAAEAARGDAVAIRILQQAADALGETFRDLATSLGIEKEAWPVVGVGGLVRGSDPYWNRLRERVLEIAPASTPVRLTDPAVVGIAIAGLRHLHGAAADAPVAQLRLAAREYTWNDKPGA